MPKISVIMPVYNGGKYLRDSIESILDQSFVDFEFIIVDDGSIDNSVEIIKSFSDSRITLIKTDHGGIVKALNKGIEVARGEYVARADADDISVPERLEKLCDFMEQNPKVAICGSWATTINEKGEGVSEMKYPPVENGEIRKYALLHNPFIHPSVILRMEVLKKLGGYRNFKHTEDYELWTRILRKDEGYNIPDKLLKYRIHSDQVTKKNNLKMRLLGVLVRALAIVRLAF